MFIMLSVYLTVMKTFILLFLVILAGIAYSINYVSDYLEDDVDFIDSVFSLDTDNHAANTLKAEGSSWVNSTDIVIEWVDG